MSRDIGAVILAGGSGTRLWPLSRKHRTKPLLPLAEGVSPFKKSVELARKVAGTKQTCIVASKRLARELSAHLKSRPKPRILVEPVPKDTAAAAALGTAWLDVNTRAKYVLCLPADQWIRRHEFLVREIRRIVKSKPKGWLITFGIPAKRPEPGYGYIKLGDLLTDGLRKASRFVEKPNRATSEKYVRSGNWVWNSGMFLWPTEAFLQEVGRFLPMTLKAVQELTSRSRLARQVGDQRWRRLQPISVDHGIMEKSRKVAILSGQFGWTDLGSWDALGQVWPRASDGSRFKGLYRSLQGRDCLVYTPDHLCVNVGVKNIGLIITKDAILLFDRNRQQEVRRVVKLLSGDLLLQRFV